MGLNMKRHVFIFSGSLAVSLALASCSNKGSTERAVRTKVFDSAEPATKAIWDAAVSALKTNDPVGSQLALFDLRGRTNLTTEQMRIVDDTLKAVSARMFDAASRGDTNALEAMEELSRARAMKRMR